MSLILFSDLLLRTDGILSKVCWFSDDWTADKRIGGSYLQSQRSLTDHYLSIGNYQATTKNHRPRLKPRTANRPTQLNFPPEILGQWLLPSHLYWLNYSSENKICCFPRLLKLLFTDRQTSFHTVLYCGCGQGLHQHITAAWEGGQTDLSEGVLNRKLSPKCNLGFMWNHNYDKRATF